MSTILQLKKKEKRPLLVEKLEKNVFKKLFHTLEIRKMAFVDIIVVCTYQMDFVSPGVDFVPLSYLAPS